MDYFIPVIGISFMQLFTAIFSGIFGSVSYTHLTLPTN
jgi:hypothetical protein